MNFFFYDAAPRKMMNSYETNKKSNIHERENSIASIINTILKQWNPHKMSIESVNGVSYIVKKKMFYYHSVDLSS